MRASGAGEELRRNDGVSQVPWWIWVVLVCATVGISFAGVLLQNELQETPPITRACWRLSLTTFFLAPLATWEYMRWDEAEEKVKMREWKTWALLMISALALGMHFAAWVTSLDLTSLAHSLLFVTTSPVLILIGNALFTTHRSNGRMEIVGVVLSAVGTGITLLDIRADKEVTAKGDALSFLGAICIVFHIACGKSLRSWMPTTVYAFPVTFGASMFLALIAVIFGEDTPVFGWAHSPKVGWFLLLAFISGIIGHTGFNLALGYVSSIIVSVSTTMEPVVGTVIGYLTYKTSPPGLWTSLGGPLLLGGIVCVIKAGDSRRGPTPTTTTTTEAETETAASSTFSRVSLVEEHAQTIENLV
jgi:drug/metabolite transporter (DMT)-like permease